MGIAMQLSGRFGPGLDTLLRKLAGLKRAMGKGVWQRLWKTTPRLAITSESGTGEVFRRDNPLGHRAKGLEKQVRHGSSRSFHTVRD